MTILRRVQRTLAERSLMRAGDAVVVAVSGGPDSTALLHVLARLAEALSLRIAAVAVDHGLRAGASAEIDAVEALCRALGVPFERVAIASLPAEASVQGWARRVRYEALREAASRRGARVVATGHTADDQAETVLARLLRGAGLRGLSAIDPARADGVVRPLIDCRRDALRAYLADAGISFASDPSNLDPRFERTRVRHAVVPALVAEQPLAVERLAAIADEARDAERALDAVAAGALARAILPEGLSIEALRDAPAAVRARALRRWAEEKTSRAIGRAHLVALLERLQGPGEVLLPGGWIARGEAERLHLDPPRNGALRAVSVAWRPVSSASATDHEGSPDDQCSDEEE